MKKCEKCGMEFKEDYAFCPSCGGDLVDFEPPEEEKTETPEAEEAENAKVEEEFEEKEFKEEAGEEVREKLCPACGTEIPEGYVFCPECGTKIEKDEEPIEEAKENICPECGTEIPEGYVFCPECGTKVGNSDEAEEKPQERAMPERTAKEAAPAPTPATKPPKKKMSKKTKLIIAGAAALALIIVIFFVSYTSPRDMVINSGDDIEVFVGDDYEIPVSAEGLSDAELQGIIWTSDDENLIKVENGVLKASYDKNSFNATIDDTEGNDEEECTYTSYIYGHMEKGLKKWDGSAKVVVSLKPVDFESGKLIKKPADARNSYIEITGSDKYNTYFYFESKTKPANDMSFLIKKGETTKVDVPCDTYYIYEAAGDTWYGSKILFGPQTFYVKDEGEYEFTSGTYWTLKQGVEDGNINYDDINSSDFPE